MATLKAGEETLKQAPSTGENPIPSLGTWSYDQTDEALPVSNGTFTFNIAKGFVVAPANYSLFLSGTAIEGSRSSLLGTIRAGDVLEFRSADNVYRLRMTATSTWSADTITVTIVAGTSWSSVPANTVMTLFHYPVPTTTVQNEGTAAALRPALNFLGAGVDAVDNAGANRTDVSIFGPFNPATTGGQSVAPIYIPQTTAWTTGIAGTYGLRFAAVWLTATTYNGIAVNFISAGSGSTVRAALYAHNSSLFSPAAMVAGSEIGVAVPGTGNRVLNFGSTVTIPSEGFYWIAIALDAGTATMGTIQPLSLSQTQATSSFPKAEATTSYDIYWTTGALPSTGANRVGPVSGTYSTLMPFVAVRKA